MKARVWSVCFMLCTVLQLAHPGAIPKLPREDRVRIEEMYRLGEAVQDSIWSGWNKAPFGVLLVTPQYEFLFRHSQPTNNFDTLGYNKKLHALVFYRKRLFSTNLLATMPAINMVSTIVVGQPEQTEQHNPTAWVITLLHEHFHQLQQSQADYFSSTEALNLSHGDKSGMWMLNYPFPYESDSINYSFTEMCRLLSDALVATPEELQTKYLAYRSARLRFQSLLSQDDYKYFSLQVWQEGVSRYTELRVAEMASKRFKMGKEFRSLKGVSSFAQIADSLRSSILSQLPTMSLSKLQRVVFYTFGASEALLLDKVRPGWQQDYFKHKFFLEQCFGR